MPLRPLAAVLAAGDNDTAAQHFQQAAEFAHRGEMPLLAALAGLDCGGEAGEAIMSAFGEMGKQRAIGETGF